MANTHTCMYLFSLSLSYMYKQNTFTLICTHLIHQRGGFLGNTVSMDAKHTDGKVSPTLELIQTSLLHHVGGEVGGRGYEEGEVKREEGRGGLPVVHM